MPYIKQGQRDKFSRMLDELENDGPDNAGELNFLFTRIIQSYLLLGESYQAYNDVIGALEGCKLELYRRQVADYETKKAKENGDVY